MLSESDIAEIDRLWGPRVYGYLKRKFRRADVDLRVDAWDRVLLKVWRRGIQVQESGYPLFRMAERWCLYLIRKRLSLLNERMKAQSLDNTYGGSDTPIYQWCDYHRGRREDLSPEWLLGELLVECRIERPQSSVVFSSDRIRDFYLRKRAAVTVQT